MKYSSIVEAAAGTSMTVPEGWGQGRATFGGIVGAILIAHMDAHLAAEQGDQRAPLRSFSLSFVAPMAPGPLRLSAQTLRAGKSVTQVQVSAHQDDQVVAVMLGSLGQPRPSSLAVAPRPAPAIRPAADCVPVPFVEGLTPDFLRHFDLLYADDNYPYTGSSRPDFQGYMRFAEDGQPQDTASLACLVDTWPASVITMLKKPAPMSSLTWTMDFLVDPATLPPTRDWQYDVVTDAFADGYGHTRSRIWDEQGTPVAFSRQTVVVFA
ncbi:thioesterase family protein [Alloalcanivorax marinus]|uniref:thioesterase family protein n=1 Tax=Alloalcanivorax marinus TaxID=1177169 RepID=UPI0019578CE7|nr:thioesterase family protein [Alloalcanivorax marinus]MBM7333330.1 thioesterase family protein [Alloalcanivorax marinus]